MKSFYVSIFNLIKGHTGEIISVSFNTRGDQVITASFDRTVAIWDVRTGE
jgi:dynein assembly factor with WDR repeat domains 1